jgi:2-polyprenyl-3-methyl-5-hydroxy-6-metoxy-1,4-benzoquinol methylase
MTDQVIDRGKPADYGQEIVKRRGRITARYMSLADKLVLDFGAGNGAQTMELLQHGCRVVACDIDAGDIAILKSYLGDNNVSAVTPVLYDGVRLPAPDGHFDAVVCYQVLEHVTDEAVALTEIRRVLKPAGDLVISVPNKWWVFETHGARLPLLPWNRVPFFSWLPRAIHKRYARARIYRRWDIIEVLKSHGFRIVQSGYMTAPMDVVRSKFLQAFLRKTIFRGDQTRLPLLATEVFVHCRKLE